MSGSSPQPVERFAATGDGASLCYETFGDPADPTLLLIAGGGQSMVWWEAALCARLAGLGLCVVRYDHRDTGRSTQWPAGAPGYGGDELAADPLAVLDALGVWRAHIAGMSMGGGIAQRIAIDHGDRLRTLTLVATSPTGPGHDDLDLPAPTPELAATFDDPLPEPDWNDHEAAVAYRTAIERPYAGALGFDEARVAGLARLEVERTPDLAASVTNHFVVESHWCAGGEIGAIALPTLVVHGTADPLLPFPHGEALVAAIPGARLVALEGVGHEIPPPAVWDVVVTAVGALVA